MNEKTNDVNPEMNHVIATLVATYDLSHSDEQSVKSIDYLCIYEYQYDGKTYKYRTRQQDNFSQIPEEIELCFKKDPKKAFKKRENNEPSSESKMFWIIFFIIGMFLLMLFINGLSDTTANNPFIMIFFILIFIFVILISFHKKKNKKDINELLEEAMINNRTVIAHLTKWKYIHYSPTTDDLKDYRDRMIYENPYRGKYTYTYNKKEYKIVFYFSTIPPKSIRLFFNKNPKDIIHMKW